MAFPVHFTHIGHPQKTGQLVELTMLALFAELKGDNTHTKATTLSMASNYYFVSLSDSNQLGQQTRIMSAQTTTYVF